MSSSLHSPRPVPAGDVPRLAWSVAMAAGPRGLALAREKGWLLVWDENHWLYLLTRAGERQAQMRCPGTLTAACCADDGSAYAAVGARGEVWWLAPDLMARWERSVGHRAVAAALDPFGQYLAVADARGGLHFFNRFGQPVAHVANPRPLVHLAFIPEAPYLVGSADFGLVACFDLTGKCVWRDGLVSNIGSLAASGDGSRIVLACYTEGLRSFSPLARSASERQKQERLAVPEPCRLVALSYDGRFALVGGLGNPLLLLDRKGRTLRTYPLDKPAVALALSALGDSAFAAQPDGRVLGLDLREAPRP